MKIKTLHNIENDCSTYTFEQSKLTLRSIHPLTLDSCLTFAAFVLSYTIYRIFYRTVGKRLFPRHNYRTIFVYCTTRAHQSSRRAGVVGNVRGLVARNRSTNSGKCSIVPRWVHVFGRSVRRGAARVHAEGVARDDNALTASKGCFWQTKIRPSRRPRVCAHRKPNNNGRELAPWHCGYHRSFGRYNGSATRVDPREPRVCSAWA